MRPVTRRALPRSLSHARWALGLAVWALVLAQWLSLVHAVGHPGVVRAAVDAASAATEFATSQSRVATAAAPSHAAALLQFATAHVDGSPACHLFDDLAQPAPAVVLTPAPLLVLLQATPAPALQDGRRREPPGLFHARAPPAFA